MEDEDFEMIDMQEVREIEETNEDFNPLYGFSKLWSSDKPPSRLRKKMKPAIKVNNSWEKLIQDIKNNQSPNRDQNISEKSDNKETTRIVNTDKVQDNKTEMTRNNNTDKVQENNTDNMTRKEETNVMTRKDNTNDNDEKMEEGSPKIDEEMTRSNNTDKTSAKEEDTTVKIDRATYWTRRGSQETERSTPELVIDYPDNESIEDEYQETLDEINEYLDEYEKEKQEITLKGPLPAILIPRPELRRRAFAQVRDWRGDWIPRRYHWCPKGPPKDPRLELYANSLKVQVKEVDLKLFEKYEASEVPETIDETFAKIPSLPEISCRSPSISTCSEPSYDSREDFRLPEVPPKVQINQRQEQKQFYPERNLHDNPILLQGVVPPGYQGPPPVYSLAPVPPTPVMSRVIPLIPQWNPASQWRPAPYSHPVPHLDPNLHCPPNYCQPGPSRTSRGYNPEYRPWDKETRENRPRVRKTKIVTAKGIVIKKKTATSIKYNLVPEKQ